MEMQQEAAWRTLRANRYKSDIAMCGILGAVATIALAVFVLIVGLPLLPPGLLEYGYLYHLPHVVFWILALAVSGTQSFELLALTALISVAVVVMDAWPIAGVFVPWIIGCFTSSSVETLITECAISSIYLVSLAAISLILLVTSVSIFVNAVGLIGQVRPPPRPSTASDTMSKKTK